VTGELCWWAFVGTERSAESHSLAPALPGRKINSRARKRCLAADMARAVSECSKPLWEEDRTSARGRYSAVVPDRILASHTRQDVADFGPAVARLRFGLQTSETLPSSTGALGWRRTYTYIVRDIVSP
jgi:hypothetical protein